ncbi:MAG: HD domain-containing protein [Actinomycetota bacterium]|nr:HD domain-containing protein [Actinomycetota bacterium]
MRRSALHLPLRFLETVRKPKLHEIDDSWAHSKLSPSEIELWVNMGSVDRRHCISVAKNVEKILPNDQVVIRAALLHDIGKSKASSSALFRVFATVISFFITKKLAQDWMNSRALGREVGQYLCYPSVGAELLKLAGSDPFVCAWANEHHFGQQNWTVDRYLGRILEEADEQTNWKLRL